MSRKSTIERALELARGGECRTIEDIRRRLRAEHYEAISSHLAGASLAGQLRAAMKASQAGS